jgi:tetratricopeptide (TPR) repeat protein
MVAALLMDSAALIASKINMASLRYRRADDLESVLSLLQQALEDFVHVRHIIECDPLNIELLSHSNFMDVFGLLEIVGHLNVGTVLYRLNKVRDAKSSFECAIDKLEKKTVLDDEARLNNYESGTNSSVHSNEQHHPHDDNRLPSNDYMLLVIRASISRTLLRLSDHSSAWEICKLIAEANKPHRRNSTRVFHRVTSHAAGAGYSRSDSFSVTTSAVDMAATAYQHNLERRYKWLSAVAEQYLIGMIHEAKGETEDYKSAVIYYNRLLSETRKKFDHRHPFICSLLERRGAVLFEQRKLQCSMLSYLACLKILEHQQFTQNKAFNEADMARVLYAVARVLHDKEDYHDALHMYQRALVWQRSLADDKPSLNVITTLCNISRVHHLSGEIDEALATNQEVLQLAAKLVGGKMDHPFLIHRLKVEGNILIEAGRLEDAMNTFIDAARRCCEDGQNRMITTLMGGGSTSGNAQEDANAGDSSVLSIRSAAALAHIAFLHPAAPAG